MMFVAVAVESVAVTSASASNSTEPISAAYPPPAVRLLRSVALIVRMYICRMNASKCGLKISL